MKHSEETKAKIRASKLGKRRPDVSIRNRLLKTGKPNLANRAERNGMWKGGDIKDDTSRVRARTLFGRVKNHEIHHIDGNPFNNSPENIIHASVSQHMMLDGRLNRRSKEGRFL